jgi:hypothetical protein
MTKKSTFFLRVFLKATVSTPYDASSSRNSKKTPSLIYRNNALDYACSEVAFIVKK